MRNLEFYNQDNIYEKYNNERKSNNRKKKSVVTTCVIVTKIYSTTVPLI